MMTHSSSNDTATTQSKGNVDQQEIAKFEALAAQWWDTSAEFAPLHQINPLRLNWIDEQVGGLSGKQVLDVGCGGGILSESMARRGAHVLGIDLGAANIAAAQCHADQQGVEIDYQTVAIEQLAEQTPNHYDVVTCMEMLEHVPDPSSIIRAISQLLKPNGMAVLSTLNRNPKSYVFAILGAEYILNLVPRGTHDYAKFITPAEMDRMVIAAALQRRDMTGLHYNPLSKRYWLADNVDVNYMMSVCKPTSKSV